jgi:hypothetical protein
VYSEQFDDGNWAKSNATITANSTTAPDGTTTADKLIDSTSTSTHIIFQSINFVTLTNYSISVYVKASEITSFNIFSTNSTGLNATFDLSNGTVSSVGSGGSATITPSANNWYRCQVNATITTTGFANVQFRLVKSGNTNYTGNGTDGLFLWGAQLEVGSYPTTYIPTTTASATRVADSAFKAGLSSLFGTQGTWYIEMSPMTVGVSTTDFKKVIGLFQVNNSIADCIYLEEYIGTWGVFVRKGNATIVSRTYGTQPRKLAVTFGATGSKIYIDGVQAASTATNTSISPIQISTTQNAGSAIETVLNVSQIAYFTTPLTNAELASLTTI